MRCKQRYLLRAKRYVRPRAKLRACRNLSFHNNTLHNGALVIVRPTDVNSIIGSNEELKYRDDAVFRKKKDSLFNAKRDNRITVVGK